MRFYRWLLKLYPARFREEYETPLERQFRDDYRDARSAGERAAFFARAWLDLAVTIPAEISRELLQDLRYAARVYRGRALVTTLALTALALAIGTTTGIFSVLNAVLLRSLPFRDPPRLVELLNSDFPSLAQSAAPFHDRGMHSSYLEDAAMFTSNEMSLSRTGESVRARVTETSSNFFDILGTEPKFGRSFAAGEDVPGRGDVAVVSYGLWQEAFGGDPRVLGTVIRLNGAPVTLIGVARPGFDYPDKTQIWTPTVFDLQRIPKSGFFTRAIGRIKTGLSVAQARSMFEAEMRRALPSRFNVEEINRPKMTSLRDQLADPVQHASLVLFGTVVFVLLIACANVAQLLLARTTERYRELAVRAALGASRARLVQQLITESTVLTIAAAAAGLAVAEWVSRLAASIEPAPLATQFYTILDGRVLGFAVGVAVLTGVLFGVIPALVMGRMQLSQDVIRNQPGVQGSGVRRMRAGLILMQSAFTVVLLAGSFTMGRRFLRLLGTDLGFGTSQVVTLNVSLAGSRYLQEHAELQYYREALDRLRTVPGVEAVGAVGYLPLERYAIYMGGSVIKLDSGQQVGFASWNIATPGYFGAMREEVTSGREFTSADWEGSDPVVIANEEFARQSQLGGGIVGRTLTMMNSPPAKIVGVVRTARNQGPVFKGGPEIYRPLKQHPPRTLSFVARVRGDVAPYLAICRGVVQQMDREIPIYDVQTLEQRLSETLVQPRFYTTAILFLGGFALLLAVLGVYGVAAYSIAQRTHEMGVRMAVGASSVTLRAMLLRQSLTPIVAGMIVGVARAVELGRFLEHLVASTEPLAAWTCASAVTALVMAASIAVWTASARVLRIDPMQALRAD